MMKPLSKFNLSVFFQTQIFLLPVLLLFYQHNGLTIGDFFLFQGIFSLAALLFEVPAGYIGDLFPKRNILILSYTFFIARLILWLGWARYGYWVILAGEILYAMQKASFSGAADGYVFEFLKSQGRDGRMPKRYGKLNFCMSLGTALSSLAGAWCYQRVSEWSLAKYQQDYGFTVLLALELILNGMALALICRMPNLPVVAPIKKSLKEVYVRFFKILAWTARNAQIRYHILYAGLMASVTLVFVWSFQPLMEVLAIPVVIYGVVYFLNHLCRALAGLLLDRIMRLFSMKQLGMIVFVLFTASFGLSFLIIRCQPLPLSVNFLYFCFLALTIGMQVAFSLANTSRIHKLVPSDRRSTVSSANIAVGRIFSGFFLILMKFLIDGSSLNISLGICFLIFMIGVIPLVRLCRVAD